MMRCPVPGCLQPATRSAFYDVSLCAEHMEGLYEGVIEWFEWLFDEPECWLDPDDVTPTSVAAALREYAGGAVH